MVSTSTLMKRSLIVVFTTIFFYYIDSPGADSLWTFSDSGNRFAESSGSGATLGYYDPLSTGWGPVSTVFGSASSLGLPAMADGDPQVMAFPACSSGQGYTLTHAGAANGVLAGDGLVSNYTIVADLLYPSASDGRWRPLFQTDAGNLDDAEIYIEDSASGGVGIDSRYTGAIQPDTWHRVAIVVRAAPGEGQLHKFIDGTFVGAQGTTGSAIDGRWAAGDVLQLFTDRGAFTAPGYVASLRFVDRNLTMAEVEALGKPTAAGAGTPGPAAGPYPYLLPRAVDIIAHRGESCCAPENTLAALGLAFDGGAAYCEVDVRISGDGVAVLMHDGTVDRTTGGTGAVTSFTAAQLASLDAGAWFGDTYVGEPVPTLQQAYALAAARGGRLYLDLKVAGAASAVKAALDGAGVAIGDTWFWVSNSAAEAAALRAEMPGAKIIWGEPDGAWRTDPGYWDDMRAIGVFGFDPGSGTGDIDVQFALAARAEGFYISNYTLLDPDALIDAVGNGAMGLETDFVAIAQRMMPPYDIEFYSPAPIVDGTALGGEHLGATASVPGDFSYDPPAGTVLLVGQHNLTAAFEPDDPGLRARSVTVVATVVAEPVTFSIDKPEYAVGEPITASWKGGSGNPLDWVGIYPAGTVPDGAPPSTIWSYSDDAGGVTGVEEGSLTFASPGLPPGRWEAFFLADDGYGQLAPPVPFTVIGPFVETFVADQYSFPPGGTVTLRWGLGGSAPAALAVDDGVTQVDVLGRGSLVVSPADTTVYSLVVDGVPNLRLTLFPEVGGGATLTLDQRYYGVGEDLVATFAGGPANATDWVGIYPLGVIPGEVGSTRWLYIGGSQTADIAAADGSVAFRFSSDPLPEGDYLAFFHPADGYAIAADPQYFSVSADPPEEPSADPVITGITYGGGVVVISYIAPAGSTSLLMRSGDLVVWDEVSDDIVGTGREETVTVTGDDVGEGRQYFRIEPF